MSRMSLAPAPVIIVTGANGGVGYGVCQRLLLQLCQPNPSDALPQGFAPSTNANGQAPIGYNGVTLIMACRNRKRAEEARTNLLKWFDGEVQSLKELSSYDEEYLNNFLSYCDVQIHELDLSSVTSTLNFAAAVRSKYPYVSHLLCIAGVASFNKIDWILCMKQLLHSPMMAVTAPVFYSQHSGEISPDNLGWVWQSNLFGHFILFRELEQTLSKSPLDPRVVWCTSLEASPKFYDSEDWQLIKTEHSYESVKYQIDLVSTTLDSAARNLTIEGQKRIRHFVAEPGVCSTSISKALVGPIMDSIKVMLFYVARFFGSPHHSIDPWKAAIPYVHLVLAPLCFLSIFMNDNPDTPIRFGACTGQWGEEYVGRTEVKEWTSHQDEGRVLVKNCDDLYNSLKASLTLN